MRTMLIALIGALIVSGCQNTLTLRVDGQKYVQTLPETVEFPIVIEELSPEQVKELELDAAEAAAEAEEPKPLSAVMRHKDGRAFRVRALNGKYKTRGGALASVGWIW